MPSADRKQHKKAGDREPDDGAFACELRPFAHPVSEALALAAAVRAERHKPRGGPWVMLGDVFAHMGFIYNGAATRQLRPRLDALSSEQTRRHGVKLWVLTNTGRRRLAQARRKGEAPTLPESPQHRKWRHSRATAAERIEGYREEFRALLDEAGALLDAGTRAHSDSWFRLTERLPMAAKGIGAAIYCLVEWPEPDDARPDIDDYSDLDDDNLDPEERGRPRRQATVPQPHLRGRLAR